MFFFVSFENKSFFTKNFFLEKMEWVMKWQDHDTIHFFHLHSLLALRIVSTTIGWVYVRKINGEHYHVLKNNSLEHTRQHIHWKRNGKTRQLQIGEFMHSDEWSIECSDFGFELTSSCRKLWLTATGIDSSWKNGKRRTIARDPNLVSRQRFPFLLHFSRDASPIFDPNLAKVIFGFL